MLKAWNFIKICSWTRFLIPRRNCRATMYIPCSKDASPSPLPPSFLPTFLHQLLLGDVSLSLLLLPLCSRFRRLHSTSLLGGKEAGQISSLLLSLRLMKNILCVLANTTLEKKGGRALSLLKKKSAMGSSKQRPKCFLSFFHFWHVLSELEAGQTSLLPLLPSLCLLPPVYLFSIASQRLILPPSLALPSYFAYQPLPPSCFSAKLDNLIYGSAGTPLSFPLLPSFFQRHPPFVENLFPPNFSSSSSSYSFCCPPPPPPPPHTLGLASGREKGILRGGSSLGLSPTLSVQILGIPTQQMQKARTVVLYKPTKVFLLKLSGPPWRLVGFSRSLVRSPSIFHKKTLLVQSLQLLTYQDNILLLFLLLSLSLLLPKLSFQISNENFAHGDTTSGLQYLCSLCYYRIAQQCKEDSDYLRCTWWRSVVSLSLSFCRSFPSCLFCSTQGTCSCLQSGYFCTAGVNREERRKERRGG